MSYTPPFIPRADSAFLMMACNFARAISNDPPRFMMTAAEAASIQQAYNRFASVLGVATNEATRTRSAIAAKDDARSILQSLIRQYAAFIRFNDGITDSDKINVGVPPRNIAHNDRTCPGTQPLVNFIGSIPGVDELRYHDSSTPDSKAKPYGAERLELWVAYGTGKPGEPAPTVAEAQLVGSFKKSRMLVDQEPDRDSRMGGDGKPTYWARWVGFDGKTGQWSRPCRPSTIKKQAKVKDANAKTEQADGEADTGDQPLRKAA